MGGTRSVVEFTFGMIPALLFGMNGLLLRTRIVSLCTLMISAGFAAVSSPAFADVPVPVSPPVTLGATGAVSVAGGTGTAGALGATSDEDIPWRAEYSTARDRMIAGDFSGAAATFDDLMARAKTDTARRLAAELGGLCREWQKRGLVFVRRADLGDSTLASRASGERSADEISVLYTAGVTYGLATGGWLSFMGDANSSAAYILPALGLAGAGAGAVYLLDRTPLKYGVPQSIVTGMNIGLWEGLLWSLYNQASQKGSDEWKGTTVASVVWGSATLGGIVGGIVGSSRGTTPGRASFVGSTAAWTSAVTGLLTAAFIKDFDSGDEKALLGAAVGYTAGAGIGMAFAGSVAPSTARVRFLDLGALAGGLVTGGLSIATVSKNSDGSTGQRILGLTGVGIAAGFAAAWYFTRNMEPDVLPSEESEADGKPKPAKPVGVSVRPMAMPLPGGAMLSLSGTM